MHTQHNIHMCVCVYIYMVKKKTKVLQRGDMDSGGHGPSGVSCMKKREIKRGLLLVIDQFVFSSCLRHRVASQHRASPPPRGCVSTLGSQGRRSGKTGNAGFPSQSVRGPGGACGPTLYRATALNRYWSNKHVLLAARRRRSRLRPPADLIAVLHAQAARRHRPRRLRSPGICESAR